MIQYRDLKEDDFDSICQIDRTEIVKSVYRVENGKLILISEYYEIPPWSSLRIEEIKGFLQDLYRRNALIVGAFENNRIIGIMALDNKKRGSLQNKYQLVTLHIDKDFRNQGIGKKLIAIVIKRAIEWGGHYLYISASPAKNAMQFYLGCGAFISEEIEQDLYEKEPDDIHLELSLETTS